MLHNLTEGKQTDVEALLRMDVFEFYRQHKIYNKRLTEKLKNINDARNKTRSNTRKRRN